MNDHDISALVSRLGRPHRSGGIVIERAAIQAAGANYPAVINWILTHEGRPETAAPVKGGGGLHGSRITGGGDPASQQVLRFVLPAGCPQ